MTPIGPTAKVVVALLVAGVAIILLCRRGGGNLKYQGRSIEYWFERLPPTLVSSQMIARAESMTLLGQQYGSTGGVSECFVALDTFGTDGIPYYLWKLQKSDSLIEQKAFRLAVQKRAKTVPFRNALIERGQAVTALIHIKELGPDTLQTLFQLSTNAQSEIGAAAKYILTERELVTHLCR